MKYLDTSEKKDIVKSILFFHFLPYYFLHFFLFQNRFSKMSHSFFQKLYYIKIGFKLELAFKLALK